MKRAHAVRAGNSNGVVSTAIHFSPSTESQQLVKRIWNEVDVLFLTGGPGTGKTHTALALALMDVQARRISNVVYTRPLVSCGGEHIGYLRGDLAKKLDPWVDPMEDVLPRITHVNRESLRSIIEVQPLMHIRGRTFTNCVAVMDEAQNANLVTLRAFLSRLGKNAKLVLCGDVWQSDIRRTPLPAVIDRISDLPRVAHVDMIGQNRSDLVTLMMERLR